MFCKIIQSKTSLVGVIYGEIFLPKILPSMKKMEDKIDFSPSPFAGHQQTLVNQLVNRFQQSTITEPVVVFLLNPSTCQIDPAEMLYPMGNSYKQGQKNWAGHGSRAVANFFLICKVGGGVQTGSTRHVGHFLAYCGCPG
jgi:hypothetical protein